MSNAFPETGQSKDQVLQVLTEAQAKDLKSDGRAFAFCYDAGEEVRSLAREAFARGMGPNGLDPTVYPSARKVENGVVSALLELLSAPPGAVGTATAGGTESLMLAVKAARDFAKKTRPEVRMPKMLLPETAHASFHKAAHYLGVEVVKVDVDPITFRADVEDARRKMSSDVILVVGSAPSYAHGVIDPIPELAELAKAHGVLMHVDACVGGLVLPFLAAEGVPVPPFDFSVDGVTSMSADLHKYGFAPKGISVLLHRDRAVRDAQYFACARWSGYTIVNSTTLGSKSIAAMSGAYAVLLHLGRSGYRARARAMWEGTKTLLAAIERTPDLRVLGRPNMNLFAFTTAKGDVFELADRLTERGWHVQPTYSFGRSPAHIHLTLDPGNARRVEDFAADLALAMKDLPDRVPAPEGTAEMLGAVASGEAGMDPSALLAELGVSDGQLPGRSAAIHRMVDACPSEVRERLLTLFMGGLYS